MKTYRFIAFCVVAALLLGAGFGPAAEPSTDELIKNLQATDEAARLKAIDDLGVLKSEAAVAPLADLLKDESAAIRAHAAIALGKIGAPAKPATEALVSLLGDKDQTVRRTAVRALAGIRPGPKVTVPLFANMMEDADPGVRNHVLEVISEAGAEAVPAMIEALKNEKAAYWAGVVLRDIGPAAKEAAPALAETLKDSNAAVRREAMLALGALGESAAGQASEIAAALDDKDNRTAATFVLGQLGKFPAGVEEKIRANADSDDKMLATTSLWVLARIHPEDKELRRDTTEKLVELLKNKDAFVRVAAARALAALPPAPEITAPIWEKVLQDADETTVQHALDALAALGAPAVPRLIDALKHEKPRVHIVYILGQIGPAAAPATSALAKLIADKDERVANEAIHALAKIGPAAKDAVAELTTALEKGDEAIATAAAYALGKIGPAAAAADAPLTAALAKSDNSLALISAWALVEIHPASAEIATKTVPILTAGLTSPIAAQRLGAIEALGSLGALAKDAVPALEKATKDEDKAVRESAAQAIKAIGQPAAAKTETPKPVAGAKALEVGAVVVTIKDNVVLKLGAKVLATLPKGSQLKVVEVRGAWLGVQATLEDQPKNGWVLQAEVAPQ